MTNEIVFKNGKGYVVNGIGKGEERSGEYLKKKEKRKTEERRRRKE